MDSLTPEDTGLCFEFLEGFRLGLYMFMNYKTIQQSTAIYQVTFLRSVKEDESRQAVASDLQGEGRNHRFGAEEPGDDHRRRHGRVAKEMYCEETGDVRFGSGDERRSGTRSASRAAAAGGS